MQQVQVSVLMPVHRENPFLEDAIQSILKQTFSNFEFIIIANNCDDYLWTKLSQLNDQRIVLVRTDFPGIPFNLNHALNMATGKYIARMDGDDISHPQRFEMQFEFLEKNPEISVLGCAYEIINENGKDVMKVIDFPYTALEIEENLIFDCSIAHPTIMARKNILIKHGGYSYGEYAEDYDLWLRLRRAGVQFSNTREKLFSYRQHSQQSTSPQNASRNRAYVASLKMREFLLTKDFRFFEAFLQDMFGRDSAKFKLLNFLARPLKLFL